MALITIPEKLRYYDLQRHWTNRIDPHLGDRKLNHLVRDFNKFTFGRWENGSSPGSSRELRVLRLDCSTGAATRVRPTSSTPPATGWSTSTSASPCSPNPTASGASSPVTSIRPFGTAGRFSLTSTSWPWASARRGVFRLANETVLLVGKPLKVYLARHYTQDSTDLHPTSAAIPTS